MSFLRFERPGGFSRSANEDDIVDFVDWRRERENAGRAEVLAQRIRENGIYPFGDMWAERRFTLLHQNFAWVQSSQSALIIHVYSEDGNAAIDAQARFNRDERALDSFGVWSTQQHEPSMLYELRELAFNTPNTHTRWHASQAFSGMLDQIEQ